MEARSNGMHTEDKAGIRIRVLVAGAAGFIGSHVARRLKEDPRERFEVVGADVRLHEYMKPEEFCDVFYQVDLRGTCCSATRA